MERMSDTYCRAVQELESRKQNFKIKIIKYEQEGSLQENVTMY